MQASHQATTGYTVLAAADPVLESRSILLTVEQFSARNPAFTPAALRNLIFKAESRQSSKGEIAGNGLIECGAVIRLGRRVLLDEQKFLTWVIDGGKTAPEGVRVAA
jgi:hypothetical protein